MPRGRPPKTKSQQNTPIDDMAAVASQKSLIDGNNNDDHVVSAHTQSQQEMEREPSNDREVAMEENDDASSTDYASLISNSKLEPEERTKILQIIEENEMSIEQLFHHDYKKIANEEMRAVARWIRREQRKKKNFDKKMAAVANENQKWERYDDKKRFSLYRMWLKKKPVLLPYLVTEGNRRQTWFNEEKARREEALKIQRENFKQMAAENRERVANLSDSQKAARSEKRRENTKANKERDQAGLLLPVRKIRANLKQQYPKHKHTKETAVFMAAVMEYLAAEVLELAGNNADHRRSKKETKDGERRGVRIMPRDIMMATMNDDEILQFMGNNVQFAGAGTYPTGVLPMLRKSGSSRLNADWFGHSDRGCTTLYQRGLQEE